MFITGINGSGKTRLAVRIVSAHGRFLIQEPKGDDPEVVSIPNATRCWGVDAALKAIPGRVIYHPLPAELADQGRHFDRLVAKILALGGRCAIAAMETCDLGDSRAGFHPNLSMACRQGRFDPSTNTGRGITRVFCSQRPVSDIPRLAISEAKHYVAFFLQDEDDRRRLAKYMGPEVIERTELSFDYWYCGKASNMRAIRCTAIA